MDNVFNDYFASVGLNLVAKIPHVAIPSLTSDCAEQLTLLPTTLEEISHIIANMKDSSATKMEYWLGS